MRTPNWRWIEASKKRIVIPVLDELDDPNDVIRDQVEHDLEVIRQDPDNHPFPVVPYMGRDLPGGRSAIICDGRFLVLFVKYADHPVLGIRNFLDADKLPEEGPDVTQMS